MAMQMATRMAKMITARRIFDIYNNAFPEGGEFPPDGLDWIFNAERTAWEAILAEFEGELSAAHDKAFGEGYDIGYHNGTYGRGDD